MFSSENVWKNIIPGVVRESLLLRLSEGGDLNPVVRLKRLDEGCIKYWTQNDIGKEQEICEKSKSEEEVDRGSILTRGVKFNSAEEFLSFMEEGRPEDENDVEEMKQEDEAIQTNFSRSPKFVATSEKKSTDSRTVHEKD